jgi:hypothetical protein
MRRFEIKSIVLIITVLAVISFIRNDIMEGILMVVSNIILLIIDSLPEKSNYYESDKFIREFKVTTGK